MKYNFTVNINIIMVIDDILNFNSQQVFPLPSHGQVKYVLLPYVRKSYLIYVR